MKTLSIREILEYLRQKGIPCRYEGAEDLTVAGYSSIGNYKAGSFTWVRIEKMRAKGPDLREIALLFVQEGVEAAAAPNRITSPQSKAAFFSVIEHFYSSEEKRPPVGAGTYLSPQVKLGKNVSIGCNCVLDGEITIGDDTVIEHNVTILHRVSIGSRCVIRSGAVLGNDGFAYAEDAERRKTMVRHLGGVILGDDVHIGALTVVDRAQIDDTVIKDGCKIDSLVHIAHNIILEPGCAVVALTSIMGSVHAGPNAYFSTSVVRDHCEIGENAMVGLGAAVIKDVPAGAVVAGVPAQVMKQRGK